jgi:cell division protein FtsI (penicillin-binding protein 3)
VILDSAVGLHQGGQVSAPVFQRIAQQVLEYMHVPHDLELPASRQVLLARNGIKDQDLDDGPQEHLGSIGVQEDPGEAQPTTAATNVNSANAPSSGAIPAALRERQASLQSAPVPPLANVQPPIPIANRPSVASTQGTVVLDVEQGGIVVPSFIGKSVRAAAEMAQASGLDLDSLGSGVAQDQSPPAGSHVAAGTQVVVRFAR